MHSYREVLRKKPESIELLRLLILDEAFRSVGRERYALNKDAVLNNEAEPAAVHEGFLADDTENIRTDKTLLTKHIIDLIRENSNELQYENGFGAYEVRSLLYRNGIYNVSEDEIETLMRQCPALKEIEEWYYILNKTEDSREDVQTERTQLSDVRADTEQAQEISTGTKQISFQLNGKLISAYDHSDALNKICEFCINCKPFRMARIAEGDILLDGKNVFYRKRAPADGYRKLSNGLQVINISTLQDLQTITAEVKRYCGIDDDMITIIN